MNKMASKTAFFLIMLVIFYPPQTTGTSHERLRYGPILPLWAKDINIDWNRQNDAIRAIQYWGELNRFATRVVIYPNTQSSFSVRMDRGHVMIFVTGDVTDGRVRFGLYPRTYDATTTPDEVETISNILSDFLRTIEHQPR
jgi:hypothetical protein